MLQLVQALKRRSVVLLTAVALAVPATAVVAVTATTAQAAPSGVTVQFQSNYQRVPIRVGEEASVAVSSGSPIRALGHQWLRDGVNIPNATNGRYMVVGEDFGKTISVRLTLTTDALPRTTFVEVAGSPLEGLARVSEPTVTGDHVAGGTVSVDVGMLPPQATSTFAWILTRGATGATVGTGGGSSSSLQIPATAGGGQLHVTWKLERLGYRSVELSSKAVTVAAGATTPEPGSVAPGPGAPGSGHQGPGAEVPSAGPSAAPSEGPSVSPSEEPTAPPASSPVPSVSPTLAPVAKIVVNVPKRVKQGKKFTVRVSRVSGAVTVKASHLKRAQVVKLVGAKGSQTLRAPKLARGVKSRTVSIKVVMKDARGVTQRKTVRITVRR